MVFLVALPVRRPSETLANVLQRWKKTRRRRRLIARDCLLDVIEFYGVRDLLRLSSVNHIFFNAYKKHTGRTKVVRRVHKVFAVADLTALYHTQSALRREISWALFSLVEKFYQCLGFKHVQNKFLIPPEEATMIEHINLLYHCKNEGLPDEKATEFFVRIAPIVREHVLNIHTRGEYSPLDQQLCALFSAHHSFRGVNLRSSNLSTLDRLIQLPCTQRSRYLELKPTTFDVDGGAFLQARIVDWLHRAVVPPMPDEESEESSKLRVLVLSFLYCKHLNMFHTRMVERVRLFITALIEQIKKRFFDDSRGCHFSLLVETPKIVLTEPTDIDLENQARGERLKTWACGPGVFCLERLPIGIDGDRLALEAEEMWLSIDDPSSKTFKIDIF